MSNRDPDSGQEASKTSSVRALVSLYIEPALIDHVAETISKLDAIDQVYETTGHFELITLITTPGIEEFRDVLKNKIMKVNGVLNTGTSIVEKVGSMC